MYCKNCRKEISDDSKFCKYCGADMEDIMPGDGSGAYGQSGGRSRLPLYIGLGIVGLVVICTCVFLIGHTLASNDKSETIEETTIPTQAAQEQAAQPTSGEDGNTYNYYYYNTTGTPGSYENSSQDGYLWPSDSTYINYSDLSRYSRKQVEAIRNEIYARHGYVFKTDEWSSYFNNRSWYTPNPNYSDSWLSSVERENIQTIVQYEKDKGWK